MYDDILNPLGMQGGGVHPPHEQTFLVTSKPPQWTKSPKHFQVKTSHPFTFANAAMTPFEL